MSRPQTPNPLTVRDVYRMSTSKNTGFGIAGYKIPKTLSYSRREHKFSISSTPDITKASQEPGPTTYAESKESNQKRFWKTSNGKFMKGKKKTLIQEQAERKKSTPGPGAYLKGNKKATKEEIVKNISLGRFR